MIDKTTFWTTSPWNPLPAKAAIALVLLLNKSCATATCFIDHPWIMACSWGNRNLMWSLCNRAIDFELWLVVIVGECPRAVNRSIAPFWSTDCKSFARPWCTCAPMPAPRSTRACGCSSKGLRKTFRSVEKLQRCQDGLIASGPVPRHLGSPHSVRCMGVTTKTSVAEPHSN